MTYYQFIEAVEEKVRENVKGNVKVHIHTAVKNNGKVRKGLVLTEEGVNISPTIYLEEFYERFCQGITVEEIMGDILELHSKIRFQKSWQGECINVYKMMKDKIIYHLINRKANEEMLKEVPYVPYLDLAVVFYVLLEANQYGTATMLIKEENLRQWNVAKEEVYRRACENTERILPCEFMTMRAKMQKMQGGPVDDQKDSMYVLGNQAGNFGAATILYEAKLKEIGGYLEDNYYILPSSVHEVIVIAESIAPSQSELCEMVTDINQTQLEDEDVLSDNVYYYDRKTERLSL